MRTMAGPVFTPSYMLPGCDAPMNIQDFLRSRGWYAQGTEWRKDGDYPMGSMTFSWEQAMAMEFYNFITLGGK